jgi:hypothetical protein
MLMCRCGTWSMGEKDEVMLSTWMRNVLRLVYGPATEQAVWRNRTNQGVTKLYKGSNWYYKLSGQG